MTLVSGVTFLCYHPGGTGNGNKTKLMGKEKCLMRTNLNSQKLTQKEAVAFVSAQVQLITWSAPEGILEKGETEENKKENKTVVTSLSDNSVLGRYSTHNLIETRSGQGV